MPTTSGSQRQLSEREARGGDCGKRRRRNGLCFFHDRTLLSDDAEQGRGANSCRGSVSKHDLLQGVQDPGHNKELMIRPGKLSGTFQ